MVLPLIPGNRSSVMEIQLAELRDGPRAFEAMKVMSDHRSEHK